jgi:hypothetical protein
MMLPDGRWAKARSGGGARERAWQSMRILGSFTLPDLETTSGISLENARKLVLRLEQAGYLRRVSTHVTRPGMHHKWQLLRNSGPRVPVVRQGRPLVVYDPNLNETFNVGDYARPQRSNSHGQEAQV